MVTQNNKRILHRKEWQMMNPCPSASAAGTFIIKDPLGRKRAALIVINATVQYLYYVDEDGFIQIPSLALAGTFGAGACGAWGCWSNSLTANGGSTTTMTTTAGITDRIIGETIRFLTGTQAGKEVAVTSLIVNPGGTSTATFTPALPGAIATTDTFAVSTGRYFVISAGTIAAGIFRSFDPLTGVVTSLGTTGLPATWGTDGRLVATPSYVGAFTTGIATAGAATTLTNTTKTWTVNQWCNYQVRITSGTGIGQVRTIASNSATALTVSSAWTVNPDTTSVYAIEGNDDFLYLIGNGAVTMYRYSISAATWTTLAPTTARAGAMVAGGGANWIGKSNNALWANENATMDGRFIYSFRGGGTGTLDRYDISGGTAGAGAWVNIVPVNSAEVFTIGSAYDVNDDKILIRKDSTARFFYYSVTGNVVYPLNTDFYPDSTAVVGDKLFTVSFSETTGSRIDWVYYIQNSGGVLRRLMLY